MDTYDRARSRATVGEHRPRCVLGLRLGEIGTNYVRVSLQCRRELSNSIGFLHGGAILAIADWAAAWTVIEEGAVPLTTALPCALIRRSEGTHVQALARIRHRAHDLLPMDVSSVDDLSCDLARGMLSRNLRGLSEREGRGDLQ